MTFFHTLITLIDFLNNCFHIKVKQRIDKFNCGG